MKLLLTGLLLTTLINSLAQENSSGVFMIMKPSKNYEAYAKTVSTRDNSKNNLVFVPLNPLISADEFNKVSEIIIDSKQNTTYFYLTLSNEGIKKLKDITTKVQGVKLVLVVNDTVIGHLKAMNQIVNKSIEINGPTGSSDVLWAHTRLKKLIDDRK